MGRLLSEWFMGWRLVVNLFRLMLKVNVNIIFKIFFGHVLISSCLTQNFIIKRKKNYLRNLIFKKAYLKVWLLKKSSHILKTIYFNFLNI